MPGTCSPRHGRAASGTSAPGGTGARWAHAVVSVTAGRLGVAGLYDVGVERGERRRGIGRAVTLAALDVARSLGCGVATLNATPEGEALYRAMGFRSVGVAQTWWLHLRR